MPLKVSPSMTTCSNSNSNRAHTCYICLSLYPVTGFEPAHVLQLQHQHAVTDASQHSTTRIHSKHGRFHRHPFLATKQAASGAASLATFWSICNGLNTPHRCAIVLHAPRDFVQVHAVCNATGNRHAHTQAPEQLLRQLQPCWYPLLSFAAWLLLLLLLWIHDMPIMTLQLQVWHSSTARA
jgi:hypothetical protein